MYITLQNLEIYKLARELSKTAWKIYESLDWESKKIMGFQFIESTDSTGANIAEGYSRFHYLDKIKFYYNSRSSLSEANDHWIELLNERNKVVLRELYVKYKSIADKLSPKINNYINSIYKAKNNKSQ